VSVAFPQLPLPRLPVPVRQDVGFLQIGAIATATPLRRLRGHHTQTTRFYRPQTYQVYLLARGPAASLFGPVGPSVLCRGGGTAGPLHMI
jgi:hypothetical protein